MIKESSTNLPPEILQLIFSHLSQCCLIECKSVCRLWRQPAHEQLLNNIMILKSSQMECLSNYLENNPSYREKIKKITFDSILVDSRIRANEVRFAFDQRICDSIAKYFPKLEHLVYNHHYDSNYDFDEDALNTSRNYYYKVLYELRHSLKRINIYDRMQYYLEDPSKFLDHFPHVTAIDFSDDTAQVCLSTCLYLFEKDFDLKELKCSLWKNTRDDLFKKFIETKPADSQKKIVTKLSQLNSLHLRIPRTYYTGLLEHISKHFTGLGKLSVICNWTDELLGLEETLVLDTLIGYACSLQKHYIEIPYVRLSDLSKYLPSIAKKVYYQLPNDSLHVHRTLQFTTQQEDHLNAHSPFEIVTSSTKSTRSLHILYTCHNDDEISINSQILKIDLPLTDVKTFKYVVGRTNWKTPVGSFKIFDELLVRLPSLEKVIVVIHDCVLDDDLLGIYPQVSSLQYTHVDTHSSLSSANTMTLTRLVSMFPNLKYLKLTNFCGVHVPELGPWIDLRECNLELLRVDVDSITTDGTRYFRMGVYLTNKNENRYYKVSCDCLWVEQVDLEEYKSLDYNYQVVIAIKDLQQLKLSRQKWPLSEEVDFYGDVIESKISFV